MHFKIIGQGIAGTVLSMQMERKGIAHQVFNEPTLSSSSKVAAGLVNPIVLKRLRLVHEAAFFYEGLSDFYLSWEKKLETRFFHSISIEHIFQSQAEQNAWLEKSANPAFSPFMGPVLQNAYMNVNAPFGMGQTKNTYWLDTTAMIEAYRHYLIKKGMYHDEVYAVASPHEKSSTIWCTGHLMQQQNIRENIFSPTKGELLIIKSDELQLQSILHGGIFILPLGHNLYKVGSTYAWDNLNDTPSQKGRDTLEAELQKIYRGNYKTVDHLAGVRPNIRDRKPIIGKWDDDYIFNGLGSRGVLLAPRLAHLFLDFLIMKKPLPEAYDVQRFT